jgi:anthranilate synthase component 2
MNIVVVDNYDSFTHNMVHAISLACANLAEPTGLNLRLVPNDACDPDALLALEPDGVLLSAGPCTPQRAGVCLPLLRAIVSRALHLPLLGICLGHQTIAVALGAELRRAKQAVHGKTVTLRHDQKGCLAALPSPVDVVRYNSLSIDEATLPSELEAAAWDEHGDLMALRHRSLPLEGVQFHPESWLTPGAVSMLAAWVRSLSPLARRQPVVQIQPR